MAKYKGILDFIGQFGDESACKAHLTGLKWKDGFKCNRCGHMTAVKGAFKTLNCTTNENEPTMNKRTTQNLIISLLAVFSISCKKDTIDPEYFYKEKRTVIFREDFLNNNYNWLLETDSGGVAEISNGRLNLNSGNVLNESFYECLPNASSGSLGLPDLNLDAYELIGIDICFAETTELYSLDNNGSPSANYPWALNSQVANQPISQTTPSDPEFDNQSSSIYVTSVHLLLDLKNKDLWCALNQDKASSDQKYFKLRSNSSAQMDNLTLITKPRFASMSGCIPGTCLVEYLEIYTILE